MKGRQGEEKEVGEGKDNQQTVNRLGGAEHKGFKAQVNFMLFKHDFNFPAVGVMGQNFLIRKTWIRAKGTDAGSALSRMSFWGKRTGLPHGRSH